MRQLFDDQQATNERLKSAVDKRIQGCKSSRWHYESRLKELPSFALKLETGRFYDPKNLEDFFACMIVVSNSTEITNAEKIICEQFLLDSKRPARPDQTHKTPDHFPFDDLRLYLKLRPDPALPATDLNDIVFELQIKTFLQHAWSIATHDLIYKTDDVNWSKQRIAFQTKAMLEHAELTIQEAERLAESPSLAKEDLRTALTKEMIAVLKRQWPKEELPKDVRRLAENLQALLYRLKMKPTEFEAILETGKGARSGHHPTNLSPYSTAIQYLLSHDKDRISALLKEAPRPRAMKVLVATEIDLPSDLNRTELLSAIFI